MKPPTPQRVPDVTLYMTARPPHNSQRLDYWLARIERGWTPNRRISSFGYHQAAEFFGIWIWEYLNVLMPRLYG